MLDIRNEEKNNIINKSSKFLTLAVVIANLATLTGGTSVAWSSSALVKLKDENGVEDNPLGHKITTTEESIIASVISIGIILVAPIAGPVSDRIGRKWALILGTSTNIIAYILIAFANEVWMFYIARILNGVALGTVFVVIPNYTAEISEKHDRGFFGSFLSANLSLGKMLGFAIGPYLSIKEASFVAILPAAIFLIFFTSFIPESPYYLIAREREADAQVALAKLRSMPTELVQTELREIAESVQESYKNRVGILDVVRTKFMRKRLFLVTFLFTYPQICGINNIIFYMESIFKASGSSLPSDQASIIVGVIQFASTFFTPPLVERLGRRFMLFLSTIIVILSLIGLSTFFFFEDAGQHIEEISWLPIVCLVSFIVGYNLGLGPICYIMMGELYPPHVKAVGSAFTVVFMAALTMIVTLIFPFMAEEIGRGWTFSMFLIICVLGLALSYFIVPETTGMSLSDTYKIEEEHQSGHRK